jgi:hypothetical protein
MPSNLKQSCEGQGACLLQANGQTIGTSLRNYGTTERIYTPTVSKPVDPMVA